MAVANRFYPSREIEARSMMEGELQKASASIEKKPWAIVCPHAGWYYCLDLAAQSWAQTIGRTYQRIIFLGPSHYERFWGWAIDPHPDWETPLGQVNQDLDFIESVQNLQAWKTNPLPHAPEHCLEVLVPWVNLLHPKTKIVTALHGSLNTEEGVNNFAELLGPEDLLVISTDLSHYLNGSAAEKKDREFLLLLEQGRLDLAAPDSACGLGALKLLVRLARIKGGTIKILGYHHSGHISGDHSRVVGYASAAAV